MRFESHLWFELATVWATKPDFFLSAPEVLEHRKASYLAAADDFLKCAAPLCQPLPWKLKSHLFAAFKP